MTAPASTLERAIGELLTYDRQTRTRVAQMLGISFSFLQDIIQGHCTPDSEVAAQIVAVVMPPRLYLAG